MISELDISNSLKILFFLSELDKSKDFIDYVDFSNNQEFSDDFNYVKEENTLIISSNFKKILLVEIYEFIKRCGYNSINIDYDSKFELIRAQTILDRFSIIIALKETILWDLLTLLMLIEGNSPIIWEKKNYILNNILKIKPRKNYLSFIEYEIKLIRATLNNVCKSSDIWNYLETITYEYFKIFCELGNFEEKLKIEYILNFHNGFIHRQLNIHENNYYCWSFVNWLIFTLVPSIKQQEYDQKFQYGESYLSKSEEWIIRLLLTQPFNFGGYNALVNITELKLKNCVSNTKTDELIMITHSKKTLNLLKKIIETFKESHKSCIPIVLHFRYCLFVLVSNYSLENSHDILLENEINWIKEMNLNKMKIEDVKEVRTHIESLKKEFSKYIKNKDSYSDIINDLFAI
ncbi:hypothetical protein FG386_001858 [Cryptosporidium ryanae]|uniref:uncharacterized protein n=1 Tax=Cryptosporidium ryanae TaxID=515981 RepID=UPI00351A33F8|nr:hypothetical protein FG386_001858 [Cryptosporidium ryanae]